MPQPFPLGVLTLVNDSSGPPVYPIMVPELMFNWSTSLAASLKFKSNVPLPGAFGGDTVVKGPTLGDSPPS